MALTELQEEFYRDIIEAEPSVEEKPIDENIVIEEEKPVIEEKPIVEAAITQETPPPPYKSKKFIEVEDEKALYEKLNAKYRHEQMKPEEKAITFLKNQNPELDDNDILFMAANEFGIGIDKPEEAELTDEQAAALRKQDINRKKLIKQADSFFSEEAEKVALEDYDPLDLDPEYKDFRTNRQKLADEQKEATEKLNNVYKNFETNSKAISEITESVEIDLDEGKFAVPVTFKLNEEKQKQLADFAKRYTPTQAEHDAFNDPETGKFDWQGYVRSLAPIAFAKDIAKAGMRQALAQDRATFIEKELKNSTLRNNDTSKIVEKPFDIVDAWPFGK
jgi:hypothetical protein